MSKFTLEVLAGTYGQVQNLVPVQLPGWSSPCTPGFHMKAVAVDEAAGTITVERDGVQGTFPQDQFEPAYQNVLGTFYGSRADDEVILVLEQARVRNLRIRIHKGYTGREIPGYDTHGKAVGLDWLEEFESEGTVSRTMGPMKVPLLVNNRRSMGGGSITGECIVKITTTGKNRRVLYQHPQYHVPPVTLREIGPDEKVGKENLRDKGYTHAIDVGGQNQANFKSEASARRYVAKMGLTLAEPVAV